MSAPAYMGQASPSGVEVHLLEGDEILSIKNFAKIVENQGRYEKVADGLCVGAAKLDTNWKVGFCG